MSFPNADADPKELKQNQNIDLTRSKQSQVKDLQQFLEKEVINNNPFASQFSEVQILNDPKNLLRIQHITILMYKEGFKNNQWADLQELEQCLSTLLKRQFPFEILRTIQQETPRFIGNRIKVADFINTWVITEYSLYWRQAKFEQKIQQFVQQQKQLQNKVAIAKRDEKLNEFHIDINSQVTINVLGCYGMPKAYYSVKVQVADKTQETAISKDDQNHKWNTEFKFSVWSPHSHVIVTLLQHYPPHESLEIGSLQLPLYNFKDQIESEDDYVLEEKSGVLGDPRRRLKLKIFWLHNLVAKLEDELTQNKGEEEAIIQVQQQRNKMADQLKIMYETFHESKLKNEDLIAVADQPLEIKRQQRIPNSFEKIILDHSHLITTCLKMDSDSRQNWQEIVLISTIVLMLVNLIVLLSRPIFLQLTLVLIVGMLVWAHKDNYHHTVKFIRQILFVLIISMIIDVIWLKINFVEWIKPNPENVVTYYERQTDQIFINILGSFGTVVDFTLDFIFVFFTYVLTLKYDFTDD